MIDGKVKHTQIKIRSSTAEFLIFNTQSQENGIEVRFENEMLWLTQKMMAELFSVNVRTVNEHLQNVFKRKELEEKSVVRKFRITAADGKQYQTQHYNLDAVISIGYRVNSNQATQFRKWATQILREFAIKGYVLDKERMKNGAFLGEEYFEKLLEDIREIRLSERKFYQKITDIYATSLDYDPNSLTTKEFFAKVQNKMHFAVHGQTAAEVVKARANVARDNMGLTTWKKSPHGKIRKSDVVIAKNYLQKDELESLERIVSMYLDYAEDQAIRKMPMTMEGWSRKLDSFLDFNERPVLDSPGRVSAIQAKLKAESEFEKFRIVQDHLFESDFDLLVAKTLAEEEQ